MCRQSIGLAGRCFFYDKLLEIEISDLVAFHPPISYNDFAEKIDLAGAQTKHPVLGGKNDIHKRSRKYVSCS